MMYLNFILFRCRVLARKFVWREANTTSTVHFWRYWILVLYLCIAYFFVVFCMLTLYLVCAYIKNVNMVLFDGGENLANWEYVVNKKNVIKVFVKFPNNNTINVVFLFSSQYHWNKHNSVYKPRIHKNSFIILIFFLTFSIIIII